MKLDELMKVMQRSTKDEKFQVIGMNHIKVLKSETVDTITFWDSERRTIVSPNIHWEFESFENKVSFIEAIEAFHHDRKDIKCVIDDYSYIYRKNLYHYKLYDENNVSISTREILEGTWYILN